MAVQFHFLLSLSDICKGKIANFSPSSMFWLGKLTTFVSAYTLIIMVYIKKRQRFYFSWSNTSQLKLSYFKCFQTKETTYIVPLRERAKTTISPLYINLKSCKRIIKFYSKRTYNYRVELSRKKCKTTILLYCYKTICAYLTFWALEYLLI